MQIKDLTSQITRFKAFPTVLRLGIFVALAVVCVLMFPRYNNAFRYHYEVGKPWGYATLTADFDFPIYKTDAQLQTDQKQLLSTFAPYFKYLPRVQRDVKVVSLGTMEWMQSEGYTRMAINQTKYPLSEVYTPMTAHKKFGYDCAQNLVLDTAKTEDMRTKLLATISPTQGLVQKGEKIIDKGEIVTERNYQILQSLRRAYEDESLGHRQRTLSIFGEAMLIVLFLSLFVIYLYVFRAAYLRSTSMVLFFCLQMFIVIALACLALRFNLSVYLIPFAWVPILTRVFFDSRTALFLHFTTILISSIVVPAPVEFFFIQIVVGMVAVSSLSDMTRRAQLVQTAAWIFLAQSVAYTALTFAQTGVWSSIDLWMYLYFFICGLLTVGCYGLIYMFEKLFRFISSITLVELADINSELLHMLAERAPGTFQHSMQVSNLAAEAAKAIGANALLVRTGALYHDIGKMVNPACFTENQFGDNILDNMPRIEAAQVVISHVTEGLKLADKYNLPGVIKDFINTHHGTGKAKYFYVSYKNENPDKPVDDSLFTYPGTDPFTREQAILMMADTVEAASRSLKEYTEETISKLVNHLIDQQVEEGFFRYCPITFHDIAVAKQVLTERLMSIYHTRTVYPELKK